LRARWLTVHSVAPRCRYTLAGKVQVVDGRVTPPSTHGTGVEFDWDKLKPYKVAL
jgi:L-alanine-DL-glutamate epimerase-like enolase superfamily enzyme